MSASPFLDEALPVAAPADARWVWAVVTQSSPLRIRLDGDRVALAITPDDMGNGLRTVGQRVYVQMLGRRLVVLGPDANPVIVPLVPASGTDLNALVTDGIWDINNSARANTILNLPVPPLPESGANVGDLRPPSVGTLRVHNSGLQVTQCFSYPTNIGYLRNAEYERVRSSDGVTWGPWILMNPYFPVGTEADQDLIVKNLFARPESPVGIRRTDARSAVGYLTKNGDTFYSDSGSYVASPNWITPTLAPAWTNYASSFAAPAYRRLATGIVMVRGLIKAAATSWTTPLFTLPVGYRPAAKQMHLVNGASLAARIDVLANGEVYLRSVTSLAPGAAVSFLSLDLIFPCAEIAPDSAWTVLTPLNGFYQYDTVDSSWPKASYWVDSLGRYWMRGLLGRASSPGAAATKMFTLPAGANVARQIHLPAISDSGFSSQHYGTTNTGTDPSLYWKPGSNGFTWVSLPNRPIMPSARYPDAKWFDAPPISPWSNYGATSFPNSSVIEADDGIMHFRGLVTSGTASTSIATLTASFGGSPAGSVIMATNAAEAFGRSDVSTTTIAYLLGALTWFSLDNITYLRES